jgi:hypothetical protein
LLALISAINFGIHDKFKKTVSSFPKQRLSICGAAP